MQQRLASLGFGMALEPVPNNFKALDPHALDDEDGYDGHYPDDSGASLRKTASSRTVGRSAHTSGNASGPSSPFMQRPLKRQRLESPLPSNMQVDQPASRDAMPPPQKPMSRMQSVTRKIIPTLRKKFSNNTRITPVVDNRYTSDGDIPMYGNGHSESAAYVQPVDDRQYRGETPYMSGALPVDRPLQLSDPRGSQLLSGIGVENDRPDFTFRAPSPVRISKQNGGHQPVQLPNEPSYIRLLDGLSRDNGMELGLKDPRRSESHTHQNDAYHSGNGTRQVIPYGGSQQRCEEVDDQEYEVNGHLYPSRQLGGHYSSASRSQEPSHASYADGFISRAYQDPRYHPTTPAPRRESQPNHHADSVVSPFVKSNHPNPPVFFQSRIAEPQDSSHRFVAYPSRKFPTNQSQAGWHEPRSLNGLSFFESPVNSRNQPIQYDSEQRAARPSPTQQHQSRNLNSQGFIMRPESGQSPFFRDSAYGLSRDRPSYPQQQAPSQPSIPYPAYNRSSYTRAGHLPSTMPSIVSGRTPVCTQPQWKALQRMGVRSSRHEFSNVAGNTFEGPKRQLFSSAGRQRVRR